jgi:uncharacterized protein HemY
MIQAGINIFRPDWVKLRDVVKAGGWAFWLVLLVLALRAGTWVQLIQTQDAASAGYAKTVTILNQCMAYVLVALAIAAAYSLLKSIRKLLRKSQA